MRVFLLYADLPTGERIHHTIRCNYGVFSSWSDASLVAHRKNSTEGTGLQYFTIDEYELDDEEQGIISSLPVTPL